MLTKQIIESNIQGLTEEQIQSIVTLSENDENSVISRRVKEIHDQYDADIKAVTGLDKPGGVKTYEHLKTVLSDLKKQATESPELQSQIESIQAERDDLKKQLKKVGSDSNDSTIAALKQQLQDRENELETVRASFENDKTELQKRIDQQEKEAVFREVNYAFDKYIVDNQVRFKGSIPAELLNETLQNRKSALIKSLRPDFVDANGQKTIVFRNEQGEIRRNPDNQLQPFSAGELYLREIADLVDNGQQQQGAGTNGMNFASSTVLDLSAAKTKTEATEMITQYLMTNEGLAKTDAKFSERQAEIYQSANLSALPMK